MALLSFSGGKNVGHRRHHLRYSLGAIQVRVKLMDAEEGVKYFVLLVKKGNITRF